MRIAGRAAVCLCVAITTLTSTAAVADCRLTAGPEKIVARVIDGDTLQLDDGSRVRLAGVMAPRASDIAAVANTKWPAADASRAALETLAVGKPIRLRFETSRHDQRQDRHGQWLAHVDLTGGAQPVWLQGALLAAGHARVDAINGQRGCIDDLIAAEGRGRSTASGLWTEPAYRIREAIPARDIAAYRGTFQIITGQINSVENARDVTRLILGPDRRRDVSISVPSKDRDIIGALGGDLKALAGQVIEARGWINQRPGAFAGPDIDITLAGHVRILRDPARKAP